MSRDNSLIGEDLGQCPFCKGNIAASVDECAMFHSEPPCQKFLNLDPLEFITACNHKKASQKFGN